MNKLHQKLSLCVFGSLLVTSLVTSLVMLRSQQTILHEQLQNTGRTLASTISSACVEYLLGEPDYPYLETYIRKAAQDSQLVVFVRLHEVTHDGTRMLITQFPDEEAPDQRQGHVLFRSPAVVEAEGLPSETIGEVEVAVSTQRLQQLIQTSTWQLALGASVSFTLLAILTGLVLKRTVLKPIRVLDTRAREIQQGNLETPIEVRTRDEVGRLAGTMESMRVSLRDSYARIERQVEELKKLDRMKDEFLANTSHELKTPLNGIIGLAEAVAGGSYGETIDGCQEPLETISACARRLWRMTDSILHFSHLAHSESDDLPPPQRHRLAEHMREAVADLQVTAERRGIRLVLSVPEDLEVTYHRGELEQVVRILADNAIKFTARGWVEVTARGWKESPVPGFQLAVRDSGIGIPQTEHESIFQPFVQGFQHETRSHGGVGLGLAIAKKLIDRMGAHLLLESEEGKGTTFTILVPENGPLEDPESRFESWPSLIDSVRMAIANEPAARPVETVQTDGEDAFDGAPRRPDAGHGGKEGTAESGPHILVVDDDPVNLEVVFQVLRNRKCRVTRAPDGESCLRVLGQQAVDLVLLDIMMPKMSGYDILRTMRKQDRLKDTPVVILSAKSSPESVVRGLKMGACDYLGKPFHREELLCRVETQLKIRGQQNRLEEEVEEKTHALQAAKYANYVKTQFLANMSHEIRTPLNGIQGFLSLALTEDACTTEEEQREYLLNVQECTRSLLTIVNDILDIAKIESRQMTVELVVCHPRALLKSVHQFWRAVAQQKNLKFKLEIAPEVPESMTSDETRLRQILNNLVGNAIKFTEVGEVHISARIAQAAEGPRESLEISIHDSGIGIEEAKKGEIFRPFAQADISMTRKYGGTGLGLSISRSLATMLGGDISLTSEPGEGSTFTLSLPLYAYEDTEANSSEGENSADKPRPAPTNTNATDEKVLEATN